MATTERPAPAAPTPDALPTGNRTATLATMIIICAAVFLTALDQTVVVTALEFISSSLNLKIPQDLGALSWVVSGYLLGFVIVMPLMGRVSDLWGRRRVLLACLGVFAGGSLLCALAVWLGGAFDLGFLGAVGIHSPQPALSWLVIARFIQAVGGGAVVPIGIAAIGDLYGDRRRILALGIVGGVTEAGGALGPLYGALILQKWPWLPAAFPAPWQWIFLLNLPLVGVIMLALWRLWPQSTAAVAAPAGGRIDWLGSALLGAALLCTSLGLGQEAGALGNFGAAHAAQNNPLLLVAALVFLAGFVAVEARSRAAVIDLHLFRSAAFSAGAVYSLLLGAALIIALVNIPAFILATVNNATSLDVGSALLRMTVMIPLGAFSGGWLIARLGCRVVGAAGAALTAVGFLLMHHWGPNVGWGEITLGTLVTGAGFGLIIPPISTTALNSTRQALFGMAASVVTALRMIGMILGLAALSSLEVARIVQLQQTVPVPKDFSNTAQVNAYLAAVGAVIPKALGEFFLYGAIVALLAIIPALFLWRHRPGAAAGDEVTVVTAGL